MASPPRPDNTPPPAGRTRLLGEGLVSTALIASTVGIMTSFFLPASYPQTLFMVCAGGALSIIALFTRRPRSAKYLAGLALLGSAGGFAVLLQSGLLP